MPVHTNRPDPLFDRVDPRLVRAIQRDVHEGFFTPNWWRKYVTDVLVGITILAVTILVGHSIQSESSEKPPDVQTTPDQGVPAPVNPGGYRRNAPNRSLPPIIDL
ncbi:hypothetical protein [Antarctobacter heliothermus]|uniref:Uncharacterized protein n=1 Tax=Antarctobacter heliothermus TaxID=74033 RepID=A0A239J674_9RHOB|nr:hypothetical protein [Antarctobacter heliothermus]SNT00134.1 hypothetical protein SAMN04488078_104822 [Antarctobacter heliothermus]